MSAMRQVLLNDGRMVWVNAEGRVVGISQGMGGAEPGFGSNERTRDIMSRLPDADIVGMRGPGVVPGGERAVGARRIEAVQAISQYSQPIPSPTFRPLGGAQQNNRGNTQIVRLNSDTGEPVKDIASIVETPKANGDDAEAMTVHLGLVVPPTISLSIDVTAVVQWGIGGASFSAEVDWNQGTSFTVIASFLRVSARIDAIPAAFQGSFDVTLTAAMGYGTALAMGISCPTRRTIEMGTGAVGFPKTVAPGASTLPVNIPPWAIGFTLVDAGAAPAISPVAPDWTIVLSAGASLVAVYKMIDRSNQAFQVEGQFPIPPKTREIFITNNLLVTMLEPKLIFNLAF